MFRISSRLPDEAMGLTVNFAVKQPFPKENESRASASQVIVITIFEMLNAEWQSERMAIQEDVVSWFH